MHHSGKKKVADSSHVQDSTTGSAKNILSQYKAWPNSSNEIEFETPCKCLQIHFPEKLTNLSILLPFITQPNKTF